MTSAPMPGASFPFEVVAELVSRLSDVVHEHSSAFATIGCARVHNLWAWDTESLGLDVLQVHSYPDPRHPERDAGVAAWRAPRRHPGGVSRRRAFAGVRRGAPSLYTLDEHLELADTCDYAGAWPWSFSGTDAYGKLLVEPLRRFVARHPALVHTRARYRPREGTLSSFSRATASSPELAGRTILSMYVILPSGPM